MPMIPLSFVLAATLGFFLVNEIRRRDEPNRSPLFIVFLMIVIGQSILIGLRFGYGMEWLGRIQPCLSALIAPLAYLSFKNPDFDRTRPLSLAIHALPLVFAVFTTLFARNFIDLSQGMFTLIYAVGLIILGRKGVVGISWSNLSWADNLLRTLWLTVCLLLLSGLTDLLIAKDFWYSGGAHTAQLAGKAISIGILCIWGAAVCVYLLMRHTQRRNLNEFENKHERDLEHAKVLNKLEDLMSEQKVYLNPNLNLNHIARKTGIPARQVSIAVNKKSGQSVSQYVNNLRLQHASELLLKSDMPITWVMLETGFNTKSNFNRAFKVFSGMSPSAWRKQSADHP